MFKRKRIKKNSWEVLSYKRKTFIISRSVRGMFNKNKKWKIIDISTAKPKIYRFFRTKQEAVEKLKRIVKKKS